MAVATTSKMWPSGFEIGRLALGHLMDVNGVFTRRQVLDVNLDGDALGRWRQCRSANALALRILDVHDDRLCRGAGMTVLRKNQTCCRQEQCCACDRSHVSFSCAPPN